MITLYLLQGFLLGLAYVAPIGTQNMYVINTALREKRTKAFQIAFITVFFDISLALACFWGIGILIDRFILLKGTILLFGSIMVMIIGLKLALSKPSELTDEQPKEITLLSAVVTCFAITWLNPQALIDGTLLLGGIYASLQQEMTPYFIIGVCAASFLWFTSLAGIVSLFKSRFNPQVLRLLNMVCGMVIFIYGIKLAYSFILLIQPILK